MRFALSRRSLADYAAEPENNYQLLRFLAALMVLYGHSYALTALRRSHDLVVRYLGFTYSGAIGVDIFFVVSGFLVTGSYLARRDIVDFMKSRVLRIFPGLGVCLLSTGLILGAVVTALPLARYFTDSGLYVYLANFFLVHLEFNLPGAFLHQPSQAANGPLWTLPVEFGLYLCVAVLGFMGYMFIRRIYGWLVLVVCAGFYVLSIHGLLFADGMHHLHLVYLFAAGSLLKVYADRIPMNNWVMGVMTLIAAGLYFVRGNALEYFFDVWLVYAVFWFAYIPNLHFYNRVGDYSYGLYIYAYPIQQTLRYYFPDILPLQLFAAASVATLVCAMLSWHLVEHPALLLKRMSFRQALARLPLFRKASSG